MQVAAHVLKSSSEQVSRLGRTEDGDLEATGGHSQLDEGRQRSNGIDDVTITTERKSKAGVSPGSRARKTAGWAGSREIFPPWPPVRVFFPAGARGRLGLPSWHEDVALIPPHSEESHD